MIRINVDGKGLRISLLERAQVKSGSIQDLADKETAKENHTPLKHERVKRKIREIRKETEKG